MADPSKAGPPGSVARIAAMRAAGTLAPARGVAVPSPTGGVTAADVTAQVEAAGKAITPALAATIAKGLTSQGLTSATYVAGVKAVESVKAAGGSIAEQLAAGEKATGIPTGLSLVPGTTAYKEALAAGVMVAPVSPAPPPPDRVLSIGTITPDIKTGVELGLKTGDHFATILKDGVKVNVAVSEADWGAYQAKDITRSQLDTRIRVEAAGSPTAQQESGWIEDARTAGFTTDRDIETFVQRRFMEYHNLTPEMLAIAGKLIPGTTMQVGKEAVPVPQPGTIATPLKPGDDKIKVYGEGGRILTLLLGQFTSVAQAKGEEQFSQMVKLGIIKEGAEFIAGKGDEWSYVPSWGVKEQKLAGIKQKEFEDSHIRLGDGSWVHIDAWEDIPERYQGIGIEQGFDAMIGTMEEDQTRLTVAGNIQRAREAKGWFNKVKAFLGLTPDDISEAELRYLTAPAMPEGEVTEALSDRKMQGVLALPIFWGPPVVAPEASVSEVLRALWEDRKKKVELLTAVGAYRFTEKAIEVRGGIKGFAEPLPAGIEQAVKFGGSVLFGAASAPIYTAIVAGHLVQVGWAPDKVQSLKDLGGGIADFFISIPATVAAQPALAIGEYTGLFVVGPMGALKIVRNIGARGVPAYIPIRGMGIEYSVVRVPTVIANRGAIVTAVNKGIVQAMRSKTGTAIVRIGDGKLKLKIRSTPLSEIVGPALYHATPALTRALKKGKVTGTLYTSPHLAVRFAESSAGGTPASNPAILLIHTKSGKVKWSPTTNLYKGAKEMEAIYGYTQLVRVKSLWARLTFGKAGDFITVYNGKIIPIYRFKEPGAIAPRINLADLVAIRVKTIQASLVDLVKGKKGFEIIKEPRAKILRRVMDKAKQEIKRGKSTTEAYDIAYRAEIRRMARRSPRLYTQLNRLYSTNPEVFERTYREQLEREFNQITRERPFVLGERITARQRAQIERGIIPRVYRRFIPKRERPSERIIAELRRVRERPPREEIARVVIPRRGVPKEGLRRLRLRKLKLRKLRIRERKIKTIPIIIALSRKGKEAHLPEGSITWKQGWGWKWIPHQDFRDGVKPRTLPRGVTPRGARFTNLRTPSETIQMVGDIGAPIPDVSIDLGVADILITGGGQRIEYQGKGLRTNIGRRIDDTAKGMSVPATGTDRTAFGGFYPAESVSRLDVDKEEPLRKGERKQKAEVDVEGISRPKIAKDTQKLREAVVEEEPVAGPNGNGYLDEDKEWLESLNPTIAGGKLVNRPRARKKSPKRGRVKNKSSVTAIRGMRV